MRAPARERRISIMALVLVIDIKRCRRTSFDTTRYRTSLLIVPYCTQIGLVPSASYSRPS
jgi:hypothetical protein